MSLFIISTGVLFALFSTLILSYVSIATMVGPWIAPTLVLIGHIIFSLNLKVFKRYNSEKSIAWMQAIGAGGGIIATGVGFALPMLYFLDENIFSAWLASPVYFCSIITSLCLIAGSLGLWLGRYWKQSFLIDQKLPFPVSNLTHQVITSQNHPYQTKQLVHGITLTMIICALRDGIGKIGGLLAKNYYLFPSLLGRELAFSVWPSLWSIGFTVGLSITIPLLVGMIAKYIILLPLSQHALYLPFAFFQPLPSETFAIAFCSGIVACELVISMPGYIVALYDVIKKQIKNPRGMQHFFTQAHIPKLSRSALFELMAIGISIVCLLSYFKFALLSQVLLIAFTILATYSICQLGGKIGMIPFGRYSTFIVIPLLLIFQLDPAQATITCVFFNICAAAASDLLFDYKTGSLCDLQDKKMYRYQWIGLIATSLSIGIFLWLLFSHLQLGSEALFAQRGKAKALLLQTLYFDKYIVALGLFFGWILKKFKINPTMVFGGLIMPNSVTIGLLIGSLGTLLAKKPEKYQPLVAGILAAESLWILISIVAGMLVH